jgi:hypothetical protein
VTAGLLVGTTGLTYVAGWALCAAGLAALFAAVTPDG